MTDQNEDHMLFQLPKDLIFEILLRLDSPSELLSFFLVCKKANNIERQFGEEFWCKKARQLGLTILTKEAVKNIWRFPLGNFIRKLPGLGFQQIECVPHNRHILCPIVNALERTVKVFDFNGQILPIQFPQSISPGFLLWIEDFKMLLVADPYNMRISKLDANYQEKGVFVSRTLMAPHSLTYNPFKKHVIVSYKNSRICDIFSILGEKVSSLYRSTSERSLLQLKCSPNHLLALSDQELQVFATENYSHVLIVPISIKAFHVDRFGHFFSLTSQAFSIHSSLSEVLDSFSKPLVSFKSLPSWISFLILGSKLFVLNLHGEIDLFF